MEGEAVEQIVRLLASEQAQTSYCRVLIETQQQKVLGREIVELRIFLHTPPSDMAADLWLGQFRKSFETALILAGLELAVDDWFTPSQRVPSSSCWIMRP